MRSRVDAAVTTTIALAAFLVYARTLAPSVLPGDSGEFQFAVPLLGVAHATGYPLYLLLGKAFTLLVPISDAAFRLNLFSAVSSVAAVVVVYRVARELGVRVPAAAAAAVALAFSPTFWSQATRAEVYALNSLLVAGVVLLALVASRSERRGRATGGSSGAALGAAALLGLGLAHHRTIILLLPGLAAYAWLIRADLPRFDARRAGELALAVAAPLVLYLYVPLRAPETPYFRLHLAPGREIVAYDGTLASTLELLTGQGFQGQLSLDGLPDRLLMTAGLLTQQFTPAGIALAIIGSGWLLLRRPEKFVFVGLGIAGVIAFCAAYRIGDVADLLTPSYVLVALLLAGGIECLAQSAEAVARTRPAGVALTILAMVLPAVLLVTGYRAADRSADATRPAWEAVLAEPVPASAILVSNDRDEMMPLWYLQYVDGRRPDLLGLFPLITREAAYANVMRVLDTVVPTGRPVYLIKDMPGIELKHGYSAEGSLFRVSAEACAVAPGRAITADLQGQVRLLGADVGFGTESCGKIAGVPGSGFDDGSRSVTVALYWQGTGRAAADFQSYVHLLDAAGNKVAQSDHRPGGEYYPSSLWQDGEVLHDVHRLTAPAVGPYTIVCGMYHGDTLARLGEPVSLGVLGE